MPVIRLVPRSRIGFQKQERGGLALKRGSRRHSQGRKRCVKGERINQSVATIPIKEQSCKLYSFGSSQIRDPCSALGEQGDRAAAGAQAQGCAETADGLQS